MEGPINPFIKLARRTAAYLTIAKLSGSIDVKAERLFKTLKTIGKHGAKRTSLKDRVAILSHSLRSAIVPLLGKTTLNIVKLRWSCESNAAKLISLKEREHKNFSANLYPQDLLDIMKIRFKIKDLYGVEDTDDGIAMLHVLYKVQTLVETSKISVENARSITLNSHKFLQAALKIVKLGTYKYI